VREVHADVLVVNARSVKYEYLLEEHSL